MRVFVIGGTGFLGTYTVKELLRRGHSAATLANLPPSSQIDFPAEIDLTLADLSTLSDEDLAALLAGCDGLVFAAGVDDRVVPDAPAYPFFYAANVAATERVIRLARQAGVRRAVVFSSYFAALDLRWPEMKLAETHPYIRSRREQIEAAKQAAGSNLTVSFLMLPYIFGSLPGRVPLWKPLIDYIASPLPWVFYPSGGSAMVAVGEVASAAVRALEAGQPGREYPIASQNLTWKQFLTRLGSLLGKPKPIVTLPAWLVRVGMWFVGLSFKLRGKEGGLDPVPFTDLQTRDAFLDTETSQQQLGYQRYDLDDALAETVRVCR